MGTTQNKEEMNIIKQLINKHRTIVRQREENEYNEICNLHERNGQVYIVIGTCAVASLAPDMTIAEAIERLQTTRATRRDYNGET